MMSLSELARELSRLQDLAATLDAQESELEAELARTTEEADRTSGLIDAARLRVIEAVLERSPRDRVGRLEWHHGSGPIAQVRGEDGRLYLLTRTVSQEDRNDDPDSREQVVRRCGLVILDGTSAR